LSLREVGRERKERTKKEEEGLGRNRYRNKGAGLIGTLPVDVAHYILRAPPSLASFYASGALVWLSPYA
jgi:hypothetical protein